MRLSGTRVCLLAAVASGLAATPVMGEVNRTSSVQLRFVVDETENSFRGTTGWLETQFGTNLSVTGPKLQGAANFNIARRFELFGDLRRSYNLNGSANGDAELVDDFFYVGAGATASQYERDLRGFAGGSETANNANQVQVIAGFLEPRIQTTLGGNLQFDARYRLGLTTVDGIEGNPLQDLGRVGLGVGDNNGGIRGLTDSLNQSASVSIGMVPQGQRFTLRTVGNWFREDTDELDQSYRAYSGGLDGSYQVTRRASVTGSVGYEDILNRQDSILYDPDTGLPVLGPDGDFVIDPAEPRRTAFERDGVYWTVGARLTPSRRTSFSVSGGERYGGRNINADLQWQNGRGVTFSGQYFEGLSSFARNLTGARRGVGFDPTTPGLGDFDDCLTGGLSAGGDCIPDFNQPVTPATFRNQRGSLSARYAQDRKSYSATAFYSRRNYVDLDQLQTAGSPELDGLDLDGDDVSYGLTLGAAWTLAENQNLGASLTYSRNEFAISQDRSDNLFFGQVNYRRDLGQSLFLTANVNGSFRTSENSFADDNRRIGGAVGVGFQF
ncbi:MAG: hypothetical protein WA906_05030 [Pacificimonas sp.]